MDVVANRYLMPGRTNGCFERAFSSIAATATTFFL